MSIFSKNIKAETIQNLHKYILKTLSEKGVKFCDLKAVEVFKNHGAKVQDNIVFISEAMLKSALETVPASFEIKGRDEKYNVIIGQGEPIFAPAYGPVFVSRNNERREGKLEDLINFSKLTQSSSIINMMNPYVITPNDVEESKLLLLQQATTLKYGTKPSMCITSGYNLSKKAIQMIKKVNAKNTDDYVTIGLISALSPLAYDETMIGAIFAFAEEKQAIIFGCGALPAATSPASIMGTMVTAAAELLSGIVLAQLLAPGVPCLFGNVAASTDMRFITPAIGSAEAGRIIAISKALSEFYGIPCRGGGCLSDAKETDYEAGAESTLVMTATLSSGADYIIHANGILDSFNIIGYEKFILDEQQIDIIRFMLQDINEAEDVIGLDTIFEVEHGEQYLEKNHTFDYMKKELYSPKLSLRGYYEPWKKNGGKTLLDHVNEHIDTRIQKFEFDDLLNDEKKRYLESYL